MQRALASAVAAVGRGTAPVREASAGAVAEAAAVERRTNGSFAESTFAAAAGTRQYKLFEPAGFDGEALPLIVMLHGCTQDPDDFAAGTRMNELAAAEGAFVLYPAQAPRSNASKCWNWFVPGDQRRGRGEPALIAALARHVVATHAIDPDRVYVAGLSAGGAMAAILAREYPDVFAAAGVHSGLAPGAASDVASAFAAMKSGVLTPASEAAPLGGGAPALTRALPLRAALTAWPSVAPAAEPALAALPPSRHADAAGGAPVIVFQGDADTTVNPLNANHVVEAVLGPALWDTQHENVAATPGRRAYVRTIYRPAREAPGRPSRAEEWLVHGAGHAWSGGSASGSFAEADGPDASREMLRFFLEHPRRRDA